MYVSFAIIELDKLYKKGAFKPDSIRFSHRRGHKKYKDSHHKLHSGKRADQVKPINLGTNSLIMTFI